MKKLGLLEGRMHATGVMGSLGALRERNMDGEMGSRWAEMDSPSQALRCVIAVMQKLGVEDAAASKDGE
jgi:hypothetical protein